MLNRGVRPGTLAVLVLALLAPLLVQATAREARFIAPRQMPAPPIPFGLFGSLEFKTNNFSGIKQWSRTIERYKRERADYVVCDLGGTKCHGRVKAWRRILHDLRNYRGKDQLRRLNRFVNHIRPYREDLENFKVNDYWTTPMEFLKSAGDCEDFAIIKFFSLLELGYSNEQMRIVVIEDLARKIPHAVLALTINDTIYILDSLNDEPIRHQYALQYKPVYSINLNTRWAHIATPRIRTMFANYMADLRAYRRTASHAPTPGRVDKRFDIFARLSTVIPDDNIPNITGSDYSRTGSLF